jgi:hypothetical protein
LHGGTVGLPIAGPPLQEQIAWRDRGAADRGATTRKIAGSRKGRQGRQGKQGKAGKAGTQAHKLIGDKDKNAN